MDAEYEDQQYEREYQLCSMAKALMDGADAIAECRRLRKDAEYWKKQYDELLASSVGHAQHMTGMMLKAALSGAFTPKETPEKA